MLEHARHKETKGTRNESPFGRACWGGSARSMPCNTTLSHSGAALLRAQLQAACLAIVRRLALLPTYCALAW